MSKTSKEHGFSLLEISVAVGVAAIVATAGIVATTAFIGSAQDKRDNYTDRANSSIENASASSFALGVAPLMSPSSPVAVALSEITTDGANVSWSAPVSGDPVDNYKVYLNDTLVDTVDNETFSYEFTGLEYDTSYDAAVYASNSAGDTPSLTLSFDTLPNPLLGFTYSDAVAGTLSFARGEANVFDASGATFANPVFTVTEGTLPDNVTLNASTGVITGPSDWGFKTTTISAGQGEYDSITTTDATSNGDILVGGRYSGNITISDVNLSTTSTVASGYYGRMNSAGVWQWVNDLGVNSSDTHRVLEAEDGNIIIVGNYYGSLTLGDYTITSNDDSYPEFVAKTTADGESYLWVSDWAATGVDNVVDAVASADGGAIIVGSFAETATFGNITITSSSRNDGYVAKISSDGVWEWAASFGGLWAERGASVYPTPDGGYMVAGHVGGGGADFGPYFIGSNGKTESFIAKISENGIWEWVRGFGGSERERSEAVTVLPDGSAITVGYFESPTILVGSTLLTNSNSAQASEEIFVAKISSSGNWQWAYSAGSNYNDAAKIVIHDGSGGAIVAGAFRDSASFELSSGGQTVLQNTSTEVVDSFIARVNSNGWTWAKTLGDTTDSDFVSQLHPHDANNFILSGSFSNQMTLGSQTLTADGSENGFVAKIDSSGNWADTLPGFNETITITAEDGGHQSSIQLTLTSE